MAGKEREQIAPEGKLLVSFTKAEMIIGAAITLIPGLGGLGALAFAAGLTEFLIFQWSKIQGKKQEKKGI